jgi:hypothetical protein
MGSVLAKKITKILLTCYVARSDVKGAGLVLGRPFPWKTGRMLEMSLPPSSSSSLRERNLLSDKSESKLQLLRYWLPPSEMQRAQRHKHQTIFLQRRTVLWVCDLGSLADGRQAQCLANPN